MYLIFNWPFNYSSLSCFFSRNMPVTFTFSLGWCFYSFFSPGRFIVFLKRCNVIPSEKCLLMFIFLYYTIWIGECQWFGSLDKISFSFLIFSGKIALNIARKLNVHETFRRVPGHLQSSGKYILCPGKWIL